MMHVKRRPSATSQTLASVGDDADRKSSQHTDEESPRDRPQYRQCKRSLRARSYNFIDVRSDGEFPRA